MNIELDGLRDGERFPYTSGKKITKGMSLDTLFEDFARIFSPIDADSLPNFSKCEHDNTQFYSDCCGSEMNGEEQDYMLCPSCHDHCGVQEICDDCEKVISEEV